MVYEFRTFRWYWLLLLELCGASSLEAAHHKSRWKIWIYVDWLVPELVTNT